VVVLLLLLLQLWGLVLVLILILVAVAVAVAVHSLLYPKFLYLSSVIHPILRYGDFYPHYGINHVEIGDP
jgi:hypothetical protein